MLAGLLGAPVEAGGEKTNPEVEEAKRIDSEVVEPFQAGRYAEAVPLARRSLALREKALGPHHPDVATSLNKLAALLKTESEYAAAEPLLRRALAIREKALGPHQRFVNEASTGGGGWNPRS